MIMIIKEGLSEALEAPSTSLKGKRLHIGQILLIPRQDDAPACLLLQKSGQ